MPRKIFFGLAVLVPALIGLAALRYHDALWALAIVLPIIGLGIRDMLQTRHSLLRVYPVIGHGRYFMEFVRPEIQQYFVESNTDGMPFSRELRSLVYQRAKGERDTVPFGTQQDVDAIGYEWMTHSM